MAMTDEDVRQAFALFDIDKSGEIDAAEMLNAMKSLGVKNVTHVEAEKAVAAGDRDGNKGVDLEEFSSFIKAKMTEKDSDAEIEAMFGLFKPVQNSSGEMVITMSSMKQIQEYLGESTPVPLLEEFVVAAGSGGEITLAQWKQVMHDMKGK